MLNLAKYISCLILTHSQLGEEADLQKLLCKLETLVQQQSSKE